MNLKDYKRLLKHYKFTSLDANNLKEIENLKNINMQIILFISKLLKKRIYEISIRF